MKLPSGFSSLRAVGLIHRGVAVDSMATRRVSISESVYRSLQAEGLVTGESPGAVLERCILNGVSQKAREVLTTIGQPSATANGKKGNLATKQPVRCGTLLDNDSHKKQLIDMAVVGDVTLEAEREAWRWSRPSGWS